MELLKAYSFQLDGTIHLYEATLDPAHLSFAIALAEGMAARFYDAKAGGFWQDSGNTLAIVRLKEGRDGAEPSGNSVAALALLNLAAMTGREDFAAKGEKTLRLYARVLVQVRHPLDAIASFLSFMPRDGRTPDRDGRNALLPIRSFVKA